MAWQKYTLAFHLLSPLHIGYRKVSNLQQTRGYVPGKVLWAALTARLTRDWDDGSDGSRYEVIGEKVNRQIRFGYLYPALKQEKEYTPFYPWDADFDYRFLDSYAGTALDYNHQSAAEGSLHEVEFIRPRARSLNDEESPQVYLVGQLYIQDNLDRELTNWRATLKRIQLGGERTYGWGQVQLVSNLQVPMRDKLDEPTVEFEKNDKITAHVLAVDKDGRKSVSDVTGPVEPLVGWERDNSEKDRHWQLSEAIVCYAPGAKVKSQQKVAFTIGPYGIWEAVS